MPPRPGSAAECTGPDQLEHLHRVCQTPHRHRPERGDPDQSLGQAQGLRSQANAARRGKLLHARRHVRSLTNSRVVHVQVVANGAHHHFARVQPDANLHLDAVRAPHLRAVTTHGLLHGQGGVAGPHGVNLMRQRRPKQCHDAVAHDLVHRALIAMHGGHEALQYRIEELPRFLGITVGQQLHRALQVGEQHCDLLALAFHGAAGMQDLLSQIRVI